MPRQRSRGKLGVTGRKSGSESRRTKEKGSEGLNAGPISADTPRTFTIRRVERRRKSVVWRKEEGKRCNERERTNKELVEETKEEGRAFGTFSIKS